MKLVPSMSRSLLLGLTIASAFVLLACSKPEVPVEPIRSVKVITVGVQPAIATLEYAAEVRARVESRLGFRVGGKVTARLVELGQRVKAGQVLAQLDPQDLKLATDAARAQAAAARTNRDLGAADFKRYQALKEQNFISGAELERRESTLKAAQAQLDTAQSQLSAQSNQAGYATLLADASGVVTAVLAEAGQVVSAGAPVVQLARDGARDVVFAVPEDKVAGLRVGGQVAVRPWATGALQTAVVREVAASADAVTRTFSIKAALPVASTLALGSTVSVLPAGVQHTGAMVIKLPTTALRQEGQSTVVWVLDPTTMTVNLQSIQVATADGNDVVVASGLTPGMQVVTAGVHVLTPGQKVTLYKQNQPLALTSQAQTAINSEVNSKVNQAPSAALPAASAASAGQ
ncbi:efflux RND transporter periplasmic adaptor subunit [Rhodoferax antarcticus]|uniref:Efflux transporter, RND family, MFP subunit n=1 Tax=Rhodoferax antarcticus ANT.BR TaxID=1111071 RepID=A0A1Q8YEN0_9BURK|nr:efflux RND transporter periplasmic adaptor subunit [Rhodoferax antarcticus]OLP06369.1 efflux transporter, RND family, MFP subunit [Rhodoferax antarcticus ANT.BR]